jgi:hypothetical protein
MSDEDDEDVAIGLAGQAQEQSRFSSDELAGAGFEPESDDDNQGCCA